MQAITNLPLTLPASSSPSKAAVWTGRIISGLVVAFFALDALMKIAAVPMVIEATTKLGFAASSIRPIGAVLLLATILYAIPRTAVLGAMLATAYLGGAVATMVHAASTIYFPIVFGLLVWVGLLLRRPQLRAFLIA